ncbi:MAG: hypothetical protein V4813_13055 [Gemmatimonadota bacterium]
MTLPTFGPGPNPHLNACVGYGSDQWRIYASGYRRAAERLTQHVCNTHRDQDALIFPVLFLWRHHFELQLKATIRQASYLLRREAPPIGSHGLSTLWNSARLLLDEVYREFGERLPQTELKSLEKALRQLGATDPKSMVFRYPEDLNGSPHLAEVRHINYELIEAEMSEISDALDWIDSVLCTFRDLLQDWLSAQC